MVVPHDAWLTNWDLQEENLGALQEPELVLQDPEGAMRDLDRVKSVLMQYAGRGDWAYRSMEPIAAEFSCAERS